MTESVNPETGEVNDEPEGSEAERKVLAMLTPQQIVEYHPMTPEAIEEAIFETANRLDAVGKAIVVLYEERHRAEEKYQKAFSKMMVKAPNQQVTIARAYAQFHTDEELHELNLAKEKLRYAEEMQKSLQSYHYSLMNVNKAVTAMYQGSRRG